MLDIRAAAGGGAGLAGRSRAPAARPQSRRHARIVRAGTALRVVSARSRVRSPRRSTAGARATPAVAGAVLERGLDPRGGWRAADFRCGRRPSRYRAGSGAPGLFPPVCGPRAWGAADAARPVEHQWMVPGPGVRSHVIATATLVYDGDCGICRYWVNYWQELTGERVATAPTRRPRRIFRGFRCRRCASHPADRAGRARVFRRGGNLPRAAPCARTRARGGGSTGMCRVSRRERMRLRILRAPSRSAQRRLEAALGTPARGGELHAGELGVPAPVRRHLYRRVRFAGRRRSWAWSAMPESCR